VVALAANKKDETAKAAVKKDPPKKAAEKPKAAAKKAPEPTEVEVVVVELGDAHAVLSLDAKQYRLEPAQVAYLAKNLAYLNNDLHVPSNA
jgi:hypothetical protein